jgi:hypothetical protein
MKRSPGASHAFWDENANEAELDELDAAARAHLNDPSTVVISGLLFLAWGRKSV